MASEQNKIDHKVYTHAEMLEAIEIASDKAAAKATHLTVAEMNFLFGLDPDHPDYREHRRQKREHQEYLGRHFEGKRKAKTWFIRGIFTGIGTFIFTAIWKGWDNLVALFSSQQP